MLGKLKGKLHGENLIGENIIYLISLPSRSFLLFGTCLGWIKSSIILFGSLVIGSALAVFSCFGVDAVSVLTVLSWEVE